MSGWTARPGQPDSGGYNRAGAGVAGAGVEGSRQRELVGRRLGVFPGADGHAGARRRRGVRSPRSPGRDRAVPEDRARRAREISFQWTPSGACGSAGYTWAVRSRSRLPAGRCRRSPPASCRRTATSFTPITWTATTAATRRSGWCREIVSGGAPSPCPTSAGSASRARRLRGAIPLRGAILLRGAIPLQPGNPAAVEPVSDIAEPQR